MMFSFAKGIHLMTFCCYSNHDQVAVVAKLFYKTSKWWRVMICLRLWPDRLVDISLVCLWLFKTVDGDITAHLDVALSTNTYNRVTFSRQAALHRTSEEIWKCHILWKWEQLLLPRASTVEPFFLLSYIPILRHPTQPQLNTEEHFYFPQQPAGKKNHPCVVKEKER